MYVAPRPRAENDPYFATRLALGCVCAFIISILIQSQMPVLLPALTVGLMGGMRKAFDIKKAAGGPFALIVIIHVFYWLMSLVHVMPILAILVVFFISFLAYMVILKTGNPIGMLLLIAITLMSVMGANSLPAMVVIKNGFVEGAMTAFVLIPILYWLIPTVAKTPLVEHYVPDPYGFHWQRAAIRAAVLLLLLSWLYTILDTSNMILAMAAVFALVFPTRKHQLEEAKERTYATTLGGILALTVLGITSWMGHLSILVILLFLVALLLGDRMVNGRSPPMVYQFSLSVMLALTLGALTNQEPVSATLLRVTLTLIGTVGAAYLSALLEILFLPQLKVDENLVKNPD